MKQESSDLLDKALRAIGAATTLFERGDMDFAAGRAYYAMFYTASALLNEKDLAFRKHRGLHGAYGQHFAKTELLDPKFHRWLLNAFDRRTAGDYGASDSVDRSDVIMMIGQAEEFLSAAQEYLAQSSQGTG